MTAGLVVLLVFFHAMGLPLKQSALQRLEPVRSGVPMELRGKVTKLQIRDSGGYKLEVKIEEAEGEKIRPEEKILLVYGEELEKPWEVFGRDITFRGVLKEPQGRRNPGCFDYCLYLKSQGIFYQCQTDRFLVEQKPLSLADRGAAWLIEQRFKFTDQLNPAARGLVAGVLFGDTSALDDEVYEDFRNNGTAHVLAVSGLHVGILYGIYRKLFGNRQSPLALVCLVMLLGSYGTVSMWSPSVIRASLMILLHVTAQALDLRYDMATGLSTVALFLILQNPYVIFSAGFQMSFLAIVSICFLVPLISRKIPDSMTAALAVNLGLLFYQMYQFNYVSLVSLLANIPIIYLTGILVPAALAGFAAFAVLGKLPDAMGFLLDSLSFLTVKLNAFSTLGGYGSLDVPSPPLWLVLTGYFLLLFLSSEQNLIIWHRHQHCIFLVVLAVGLAGCLTLSSLLYCPVSDSHVVFVDVGQGDCIHIRAGNRNILIDGGGSTRYNTGDGTLKPYLLKNGVWNVDLALATHLHMDHYKGLTELAQVYPVKELRSGLKAGDSVQVSEEVWIETLWPLEIDPVEGQEANENCSVFMIHYDEWKLLITGDLDEAGERELVAYYEAHGQENRLQADVLKVGHHGSGSSTCDLFLDAVNPQIAVFQVGVYNIYGHPDQKIVEKCQKRGIMVKRNDYNGGIGFSFQKDQIQVHTVIP